MTALDDAGFDVTLAFDARAVAPQFPWLAGNERCGVLVGNTRALWPVFEAARPALAHEADPLDVYTEQAVGRAYPGARCYFAHRRYDGAYLPLQQLAVATGLAALAPTHLLVHPVFGPWFALRAVVLVDAEPPRPRLPLAKPCACDGRCERALEAALAAGDDWHAWLAVRDACTLRDARYSDAQIRFHYEAAFSRVR